MATTIDDTGLTVDRLDQILADLVAGYEGIYGVGIDVGPSSVDGQVVGTESEAKADLTQLLEAVFLGRSPSGARGAQLARIARLVGITKKAASYSTADVLHLGTPGTLIPDGSLIDTTDEPPQHFQTVGDATIGGGGSIAGSVRATVTGPVFAGENSITDLKTVISGWSSTTNALPADQGKNMETDGALRLRIAASVAIPSQSLLDGIYASIVNVTNVADAIVFENRLDTPVARAGGSDLPPHSIQAIVDGGAQVDIAQAIWTKASAGVTLVGAVAQAVVDSQGFSQIILFDRPSSVPVYAIIAIQAVGAPISSDTQTAIKLALVDFGNSTAKIGLPIIWADCFDPIMAIIRASAGPPRLLSLKLGLAPTPTLQADVVVNFADKPSWDVARVSFVIT